MLKYLSKYESVSASRQKTFTMLLGLHLFLLKIMLVLAKLALLFPGLK